jgi:hypothetical protein
VGDRVEWLKNLSREELLDWYQMRYIFNALPTNHMELQLQMHWLQGLLCGCEGSALDELVDGFSV